MSRPAPVDAGVNPYVGPEPLREGQELFGRDLEVARVLDLLIAERVVLLHSPSGAGKTSLIQAGLVPQLRHEGFQTMPAIRVNLDLNVAAVTAGRVSNRYVLSVLSSLEERRPPERRLSPGELPEVGLAQYLDMRDLEDDTPGNEVLIFDQFEELLTLDPTDQPAKEAFMAEVGEALGDRGRWALFSMREEYVPALEPYVSLIPTGLAVTSRLDFLGLEAAREAIQGPARKAGVTVTDNAAARLVDELRRIRMQRHGHLVETLGPHVEPVQLQVVCQRLWERVVGRDGRREIDEPDVEQAGDVDRALAAYYDDQVAEAARSAGVGERTIREWFDHEVITRQGYRGQVQEGPGRSEVALRHLEDHHVVRSESRGGTMWYELAHDRLIEPLRASNSAWFESHLSALQRRAGLWALEERKPDLLLKGADLDEAEHWAAEHTSELTPVEKDFLEECRRLREEELQRLRQARLIRRLALVSLAVSVLALTGFVLALYYGLQTSRATALSEARELAGSARAHLADDPNLSTLLALEAMGRAGWTDDHRALEPKSALYETVYDSPSQVALTLPQRRVNAVAFSPDGKRLATAGESSVTIWDAGTAESVQSLDQREPVTNVVLAPDGRSVAASSRNGRWALWDGEDLGEGAGKPQKVFAANQIADAVARDPQGDESETAVVTAAAFGSTLGGTPGSTSGSTLGNKGLVTISARDTIAEMWDTSGERLHVLRHEGAVKDVAVSRDGSRVATAGTDGRALVWDAHTGAVRRIIRHDESAEPVPVNAVALNADGTRMATGGASGDVKVWDVETGARVATLSSSATPESAGEVSRIAFRPDGRQLAAASGSDVTVWDLGSEQVLESLTLGDESGAVRSVAFSADGRRLATSSFEEAPVVWSLTGSAPVRPQPVLRAASSPDGSRIASAGTESRARVWDAGSGRELLVLSGHAGNTNAVVFAPDGRRLATASEDGTAKIWDAGGGKELMTLSGHRGPVKAVVFAPDGQRLATAGADGTAKIWDPGSGKELQGLRHARAPWPKQEEAVAGVAFSRDGNRLATSGDRTTKVWDVATGRVLMSLPVESDAVFGASFSPDGGRLATGGANGTARLWDIATAEVVLAFEHRAGEGDQEGAQDKRVVDVAFSPDGTQLATGGSDGRAVVWTVATGKAAAALQPFPSGGDVHVAFSRDGQRLLTANKVAVAWSLPQGTRLVTVPSPAVHADTVYDVAFARGGRRLATASADGTAKVWDVASRKHLLTLWGHTDEVNSVAFSSDGRRIATASDDETARIWDAAGGKELLTLRGHQDLVWSVAFSPDGRRVVTGSDDRTARLWDPASGRELRKMQHGGVVHAAVFSPDGTMLATASGDGNVTIRTAEGEERRVLRHGGVNGVAFSQDSGRLATAGSDKFARVWDVTSGRRLFELEADSELEAVTLSPDGRQLAAQTAYETLVWDLRSRALTLDAEYSWPDPVRNAVTFSPDGKVIAVPGPVGRDFVLYPTDLEVVRRQAVARVGRSLSPDECRQYLHQARCPNHS